MNRARRIAAGNFIILSEALLSCPSAAAVNGAAYEEYPVRVIVGVVALVLALVLTLFTVLGRWIRQANKKRSYGSQMQYGTHTASHKTVKKGRRRYGKPELAMFFPSYRREIQSRRCGVFLWTARQPPELTGRRQAVRKICPAGALFRIPGRRLGGGSRPV